LAALSENIEVTGYFEVRRGFYSSQNTTKLWFFFYVLLTMHLSIFISEINQLDAQNLFHNKFYFMPLHVLNTCSKHVEAW